MSPTEWQGVKSLLAKALNLPAADRLGFLQNLHSEPPTIRNEVERLLIQQLESTIAISEQTQSTSRDPEARLLSPGDKPLDRFEILFFLGSGGMGEVYAAFDNEMREVIALKTLRSDLASEPVYLRRLQKEVQIARRLKHPNLCGVYDTHVIAAKGGNTPAVSMELLHGATLHRHIRAGKITLPEARTILQQLVSGLEAVHQAGILHRDLKTGNVIFNASEGKATRAVITDFGLAIDTRAPLETQTHFGPNAVVGTPPYMAPEQLRGEGASIASDVYSLGVVAFEIVTGRLPFEGDTSLAVALRRFGRRAPSPRSFRPDLPRRWALAILCCLDENPYHRPETPRHFLEVLEGTGGTLKAMARRHARRAAIGGVLAAAAGVVAVKWPQPKHIPARDAEVSFQKGEVFVNRRTPKDIANAITEFRQAVQTDPEYAQAWASLSNAYCAAIHYAFLPPAVARKEAATAARKALSLDSDLGKARGALAYLRSVDLATWRSADDDFKSALRLDPKEPLCHAWYAAYLGRLGHFQAAIAQAEMAHKLSSGDFYCNHQLAAEYFRARRFQDYLHQSQELVHLQENEMDAHLGLGRALEWLKRYDEGVRECDAADKLAHDPKSAITAMCFRGTLEAAQGKLESAQKRARAVENYWRNNSIESNLLVGLYARLHDHQRVMQIINKSLTDGDSNVLVCPTNPYLDGMRQLPEYQAFLRKLGFDPAQVLKFGSA